MSASITLTVQNGSLAGKKYFFPERRTYVIGRADDSDLQCGTARSLGVLLTLDPNRCVGSQGCQVAMLLAEPRVPREKKQNRFEGLLSMDAERRRNSPWILVSISTKIPCNQPTHLRR